MASFFSKVKSIASSASSKPSNPINIAGSVGSGSNGGGFSSGYSAPAPAKEERETFANDSGGRDEGGGGGSVGNKASTQISASKTGNNTAPNPVSNTTSGTSWLGTPTTTTTTGSKQATGAVSNGSSAPAVDNSVKEGLQAEEARKAEEARRAEEARKAEEARQAEIARQEALKRQQEEAARKAEEARRAEEARKAEEARLAEIARQEELRRQAELARQAEQIRQAQEEANRLQREAEEAAAAGRAEEAARLRQVAQNAFLSVQKQIDQARQVSMAGGKTMQNVDLMNDYIMANSNPIAATPQNQQPIVTWDVPVSPTQQVRDSAFVKNAGRTVEEDEDEFWKGGNPLREAIDRVNSGDLRATDQTYGRPVNGLTQPTTSVYDVNPALQFSSGNPNVQPGITRDQFLEATSNLFNPLVNIGVRSAEGALEPHSGGKRWDIPQTTTNPAVDFQTPANPTPANDPMAYWLSREYPEYTGGDWTPANKNPEWSPSNQIPRNTPEVPVATETPVTPEVPASNSQPSGYESFMNSPFGNFVTDTLIRSNPVTYAYDAVNSLFNGQKPNADRLANFFKPQEGAVGVIGRELGKLDTGTPADGLGAEQIADYDTAYRNGIVNPAEAWNSRAYPEYTGDRTSPDYYNGRELMSSTQPQPRSTTGTTPSTTNPNPVNTRPYTGTPQVNQPTNDLALEASIRRGETTYEQVYDDYVNRNVEPLTQRYLESGRYATEAEARQAATDAVRRQAYGKIYDLGFRSDFSDADIQKYAIPSLLDFTENMEEAIGNDYWTNDATFDSRQFNMAAGGFDRSYDEDRLFYDLTSELAGNAFANNYEWTGKNASDKNGEWIERETPGTYNTTPGILDTSKDINNPLNWNGALQASMAGMLQPDQILHFYDSKDSDLIIPDETRKWLASDSTHSLQEFFLNSGKNLDRLQKEHGTREEFLVALRALIEANPALKLMYDKGVLSEDDIANNFFKAPIYDTVSDSGNYSGSGSKTSTTKKSSGSSGSRSYSSGKNYSSGGSGNSGSGSGKIYSSGNNYDGYSGSSGYYGNSGSGVSASNTNQRQNRIYNIMKNWSF